MAKTIYELELDKSKIEAEIKSAIEQYQSIAKDISQEALDSLLNKHPERIANLRDRLEEVEQELIVAHRAKERKSNNGIPRYLKIIGWIILVIISALGLFFH